MQRELEDAAHALVGEPQAEDLRNSVLARDADKAVELLRQRIAATERLVVASLTAMSAPSLQ